MLRIDLNQLEEDYTEAGSLILTWEGTLFAGIAYELSPQGTLCSEQTYYDGVLNGLSKDW